MVSLTLRNVKGSPLTNTEIDNNFINLNTEVGIKLTATDYNAADVLTKLKTVDGSGSGLDADLLDGKTTSTSNTPDTVVVRDSNGNFSANIIMASLDGNAATVTNGVVTTGSYPNPSWLTALAGTKVTGIPNSSLVNSSVTINGTVVSLGGSISISGSSNTWTSQQTFRDNLFSITDDTDNSKVVTFQASNISPGATRSMIIPDETGVIATQSYVQRAGFNSQGTKTISTAAPSGGSSGDIWFRV